jgi:signal transduction histidine kinase
MTISITFSVAMYGVLTHEVQRFDRMQRLRFEREVNYTEMMPPPPFVPDPQLIQETQTRVGESLVLINLAILLVAGFFGYVLSGLTLKPIQDMVDSQTRFVSDASHELRTPLTALKSSMEVFLRDKNATFAQARDLIKDSVHDVDDLADLSHDLLQLSQYENISKGYALTAISTADFIKKAVENVQPLASQKNIVLKNEVVGYLVKGNEHSLKELFVILLDNAIKYSEKDTTIIISEKAHDKKLTIEVADQGVGISSEQLPNIFDRFYRGDSSRSKDKASGYGLGLAIAKKIVQLNKGQISVLSSVGKGSVFSVSLQAI